MFRAFDEVPPLLESLDDRQHLFVVDLVVLLDRGEGLGEESDQVPVRATVVRQNTEWNAVLAGDPKVFRLLCNSNLNMNIPSRRFEEERIRILLRVWTNIQSCRYNK